MAKKLDLSFFRHMFEQENEFEVTEEQYKDHLQKDMPKTYYLKTKSPVAVLAKEQGYTIQVEERIHRVMVFRKEEQNNQ